MSNIVSKIAGEDFLLTTPLAKRLYFECAKSLPIIDYHNHLSVADLIADRKYKNLFQLWLCSDPYKHRAMRICGVEERFITGDATDYEKFCKWCEIFPRLAGTPLFDWSIIELNRFFGITEIPSQSSCESIWNTANALLCKDGYSAKAMLKGFNVEYCAPCVSLTDDVSKLVEAGYSFSVRCDDILNLTADTVNKLGDVAGVKINTLEEFASALYGRLELLHGYGLRFTDHALDDGFVYIGDDGKNEKRFNSLILGNELDSFDKGALFCHVLRMLTNAYGKLGVVMQLHIGALRKTSTRLRKLAGAAGGYAGIGSSVHFKSVAELLDDSEQSGALPKTLLFTLNPSDHAALAVLCGSYSKDGVGAIVSEGPAWWWCDHLQGIKDMLDNFSVYGVLSEFFGMTTDSRSILSFVRHDYFRRCLCGFIGKKAQDGEFCDDFDIWKDIVERACYKNAKQYL